MKLEFIDKYMLCWLHMAFQSEAAAELLEESRFKQIPWHLWSGIESFTYCHINWSISLAAKNKARNYIHPSWFCSRWASPQEYLGFLQPSVYC